MKGVNEIINILDWIARNYSQLLKQNSELFTVKEILEDMYHNPRNYNRYFRIYINKPNKSIVAHKLYCPDQDIINRSGIKADSNFIWIAYLRIPDSDQNKDIVDENIINKFLQDLYRTIFNETSDGFDKCKKCWSPFR